MGKISTRQRGDTWSYSYELATVSGKRKRKEVGGFATEQDAYNAGDKDMAIYNDGVEIAVKKKSISVADYLDYWYENHVKVNMRYNTCYNYEKVIRLHIKPELGHYKLQKLTPMIIQNWINKKAQDGYTRSSLDDMKKVLAERLKKCRKERGFTQNQVAIYCDITEKAYQNYELMTREPKLEILVRIADLYGVSLDYLVGRE